MSDDEERKDPGRDAEAMEQGAGLLPLEEVQPKAKTAEAKALKSDLNDLKEANQDVAGVQGVSAEPWKQSRRLDCACQNGGPTASLLDRE